MREDTDVELLRRFQTGDGSAFETIFARHRGWIFGVCRRLLRSRALAEEATQDVFARCAERAAALEGDNVAGWLKAIAVNHCLHIIEKERRWAPLDPAMPVPSDTPDQEHHLI